VPVWWWETEKNGQGKGRTVRLIKSNKVTARCNGLSSKDDLEP